MGPLEGVRVLDLTHVLNGPFATLLLVHLGAEVIKLEQREGDRFRHAWMPSDASYDGYGFVAVNSGKKAITLDLKHAAGRELCLELVERSDVMVENFSPGVMDRLGLGLDVLFERNPRLVYARSSGYGYSGPNMHVRSNASTNMAVTGWQQAAQELAGKPGMKVLGVGDQASGVSMTVGVCAALYERERSGRGQVIEVSMQEALLGFMNQVFHTHFEGQRVGQPPKPCADGFISFHLPDTADDLWVRLCEAMGEPEVAVDERFSSRAARRENYLALEDTVSRWVLQRTRDELWEILRGIGLSSGPVLSLGEVLEDEHLRQRGAFVEVEQPGRGPLPLLAPWIHFSRSEQAIPKAAPAVGTDNEAVFVEMLGIEPARFAELVASGVI